MSALRALGLTGHAMSRSLRADRACDAAEPTRLRRGVSYGMIGWELFWVGATEDGRPGARPQAEPVDRPSRATPFPFPNHNTMDP